MLIPRADIETVWKLAFELIPHVLHSMAMVIHEFNVYKLAEASFTNVTAQNRGHESVDICHDFLSISIQSHQPAPPAFLPTQPILTVSP